MARPRKPTAVKKLQGTLQPCRVNPDEPQIQCDIKDLQPPAYLTSDAQEAWRYAVEQCPEGMLTSVDVSLLAMWADTLDKIIQLEKAIQQRGLYFLSSGNGEDSEEPELKVNPLLREQNELKKLLRGILTELGFTPASRSKVVCVKKTEENKNGFLNL